MKERPIIMSGDNPKLILEGKKTQTRRIITSRWNDCQQRDLIELCPYGVAGDRLWVREKWKPRGEAPDRDMVEYATDPICLNSRFRWKPSIHMPRWASRITLEILKVRVERLQDISASDCEAEGIYFSNSLSYRDYEVKIALKSSYRILWDSLHGKGAWDKNLWVWVIEFQKI
jgi:hypothetical protein